MPPNGRSNILKELKPKLEETKLTPEQLAKNLNRDYDVAIYGEFHASQQVKDVQGRMLNAADPDILMGELQPSTQKDLDRKIGDNTPNNWGVIDRTIQVANKNNIPVKAVDVQHSESPSSSSLRAYIAGKDGDYIARANTALGGAEEYLEARGVKVDPKEVFAGAQTPAEHVAAFSNKFSNQLPDFHKNNLDKAQKDLEREDKISNGSMTARVGKIFDKIGEGNEAFFNRVERLKETNPLMADNVDKEMQKLPNGSTGVFNVGLSHSDEVEDRLEAKGYAVANVKIVPTDNKDYDQKVFKNLKPNSREGAEWVVAVYDPDHQNAKEFESKFRIQSAKEEKNSPKEEKDKDKSTGQNDVSPDMQKAMAQADAAMSEKSNAPSSVAMTDLPQKQSSRDMGVYA